jgi:crossover junction endodeoxyribonuclease RuvC
VIDCQGTRLSFVACGVIHSDGMDELHVRLAQLYDGIVGVLGQFQPDETAVEETFVNKDAQSTLKLGQARGIALLAPAKAGLPVAEYAANLVKKTVVGVGHADKKQVDVMVRMLLPKAVIKQTDAADALAVALCHAQHRAHKRIAMRIAAGV